MFTYTNIICLKVKCSINIVYTPIIVTFYNSIKNMLHGSELYGSADILLHKHFFYLNSVDTSTTMVISTRPTDLYIIIHHYVVYYNTLLLYVCMYIYIFVLHFVYIKIVFHTIFIVFHYFFKLQLSNEMKQTNGTN